MSNLLRHRFPIHTFRPYIYSSQELRWRPRLSQRGPDERILAPAELLQVASWNIDFVSPGSSERGHAAMDHLRDLFGPTPHPMVVMLQEVRKESLRSITEHPWVQHNFALSNIEAWQRYFTILMVSKHIHTSNWFRVPLDSRTERDALFVDIPVSSGNATSDVARLCTTHLESLPEGEPQRRSQLACISGFLKEPTTDGCGDGNVIAGLVGGDMNTILPSDRDIHKLPDVGLHDVWEETPPLPVPLLRPFKKDLTYGRARGNTWGYQGKSNSKKRLDKFFCTGLVETTALEATQDQTGKLGRLGIGLKTKVRAQALESQRLHFTKSGKPVIKTKMEYTHWESGVDCPGVEIEWWVSDHFGIAVGVRVGKQTTA